MPEPVQNSIDTEPREGISALEALVESDNDSNIREARGVLRRFLFSQCGLDQAGGTIGEVLKLLAKDPSNNTLSAIVLLRCLAVDGLIPEPNPKNQIVRSTVELCESTLPEIISFLRIDTSAQNYQKFATLSSCHHRILEILSPLSQPYGDVDALLSAQKEILGCLNHRIVRKYTGPFRLSEIRTTIESLFSKLRKVSALGPTLLADIDECNRSVSNVQREIDTATSFLSRQFLAPFLSTYKSVLSSFLDSIRGRFGAEIEIASGTRQELQKRYPLHEPEREVRITIPLRNSGPGMATDVRISVDVSSDYVVLSNQTVMLGNVFPGDFSVAQDAMVISECDRFEGLLSVEWGEIGSPTRKSEVFEFHVIAQSSSVDWQDLQYHTPYSTDVAEGDQFVGRADKVQSLAAKLLRDPMEPFYITGQKRVGKTSLAIAAAEFAKANCREDSLDYHYILWGDVAHSDPGASLQELGESIEAFILGRLPAGLTATDSNYRDSLAGLIKISKAALQTTPKSRYVIILDEFDEIHQELFLYGNLAETFFGNLRALSRCKNICLVLVGGENMPFIMDRQGQKLNNFSQINLSYFSRESEWEDFQLLVRSPSKGLLNWHDDAVSEVFNTTFGNPYFAKIVCAGVLRSAVLERDLDVTSNEVRRAVEAEISVLGANSFAHLWQDGVPKAAEEREPDILRRMRVLVALARCLRKSVEPSATNIADYRTLASLSQAELVAVLNDFVRRRVLIEEDGQYGFALPIFRLWLMDVGVSQLVADALNEELANAALAEENAALVRSDEVVALSESWPTYRGRHICTDDIRAWYQQVESHRDQRLLFEILKRTRVITEVQVRERLNNAHSIVRRILPEFVIRKRGQRRRDVLLTYVDGEGKSGPTYASLYAEENGISADCVIAPADFREQFDRHRRQHGEIAALLIIDDIAATGRSLAMNLQEFVSEFSDLLEKIKVRVITLLATKSGQALILRRIQKIDNIDIDFRCCEVLPSEVFAFPEGGDVWPSKEDEARAKALCIDIGSKIYRDNALGYGKMGLLVVFPTTVPNNSLPILHSYSRTGSSKTWKPLFPRVVN